MEIPHIVPLGSHTTIRTPQKACRKHRNSHKECLQWSESCLLWFMHSSCSLACRCHRHSVYNLRVMKKMKGDIFLFFSRNIHDSFFGVLHECWRQLSHTVERIQVQMFSQVYM